MTWLKSWEGAFVIGFVLGEIVLASWLYAHGHIGGSS